MANGDKKKKKKEKIYNLAPIEEFTVESDGTSYKSSDGPKKKRFREVLKRNITKKPKKRLELKKIFNRVAKDSMNEGIAEATNMVANNAGNLTLAAAALSATEGAMGNMKKMHESAHKSLETKFKQHKKKKTLDPAVKKATNRMDQMDSPFMMYGKASSPLTSGSPLAKRGGFTVYDVRKSIITFNKWKSFSKKRLYWKIQKKLINGNNIYIP